MTSMENSAEPTSELYIEHSTCHEYKCFDECGAICDECSAYVYDEFEEDSGYNSRPHGKKYKGWYMYMKVCKLCRRLRISRDQPAFHVHHINHDHDDNRLENLTVWCQSCHLKHHGKVKSLVHEAEKRAPPPLLVRRWSLRPRTREEEMAIIKAELKRLRAR